MAPEVLEFIAFLFIVGIGAVTVIKVARLFANRRSLPDGLTDRVEELERALQDVQRELGEAQERLDFAERVLSSSREERRIAE